MSRKLSKKVALLGDFAVGKTSLIQRFVYDRFDERYKTTIGVKVSRKSLMYTHKAESVEVVMMVWDLAGHEDFQSVQTRYLGGTTGAILVCDLTRAATLDTLTQQTDTLRQTSPDIHLVLAANKMDLTAEQQVAEADLAMRAADLSIPYYLTSAKTGQHVEDLFRQLGQLLLS